MTALLIVALILALVVIAWLLFYQARHKHTDADLTRARQDSIMRSRSVVSGKVQEHLAPLFPEFISQFNPKDARFLGTPLDFVVFDGLDEGEVRRVVFVEVKTGKSSLASRERRVREAIEAGRVEFQLLRLPAESIGEIVEVVDDVSSLDAVPEAPAALGP